MTHEPLPTEDLRALWQAEQMLAPAPTRDAAAIRAMLRQRSESVLERLRRRLRREAWLLALAAGLVLPAFAWPDLRPLVVFVFLLAGVGVLVYVRQLRHLTPTSFAMLDLQAALRQQVDHLRRHLRLYAVITLLLVPVLGTLGVFYGLWVGLLQEGQSLAQLGPWDWAIAIAGALGYAAIAAILSHLVVWRWYVRPYQNLQACLSELEALDGTSPEA